MAATSLNDLYKRSQQLRFAGKFAEAFELLKASQPAHPSISGLCWQHQPWFWADATAGVCVLTRRRPEDEGFLRDLWAVPGFVHQFHRTAPPLPASSTVLREKLHGEFCSILSESSALHWIVRDSHKQPFGLLSLTNISLNNKSAEVLLGMHPNTPSGLATASMLMLFEFFFRAMNFNKLQTLVFAENVHSLKGTLHLGFQDEGRLREHIFDPTTGKFCDVIQTGLLASEAFSEKNQRLMARLLAPRKASKR